MRRAVRRKSEAEALAEYPTAGLPPGWHFRIRETSNRAWLAEGTDLWRHEVSCQVEEGELQPCVAMALRVQRELDAHRE